MAKAWADAAAGVDSLPKSQDPENSKWHAMLDGSQPESSYEQQKADYYNWVNERSNGCMTEDLKYAMHARADYYAPAHNLKPWTGGTAIIRHWSDTGWGPRAEAAVNDITQLIKDVMKNCPGICEGCSAGVLV